MVAHEGLDGLIERLRGPRHLLFRRDVHPSEKLRIKPLRKCMGDERDGRSNTIEGTGAQGLGSFILKSLPAHIHNLANHRHAEVSVDMPDAERTQHGRRTGARRVFSHPVPKIVAARLHWLPPLRGLFTKVREGRAKAAYEPVDLHELVSRRWWQEPELA